MSKRPVFQNQSEAFSLSKTMRRSPKIVLFVLLLSFLTIGCQTEKHRFHGHLFENDRFDDYGDPIDRNHQRHVSRKASQPSDSAPKNEIASTLSQRRPAVSYANTQIIPPAPTLPNATLTVESAKTSLPAIPQTAPPTVPQENHQVTAPAPTIETLPFVPPSQKDISTEVFCREEVEANSTAPIRVEPRHVQAINRHESSWGKETANNSSAPRLFLPVSSTPKPVEVQEVQVQWRLEAPVSPPIEVRSKPKNSVPVALKHELPRLVPSQRPRDMSEESLRGVIEQAYLEGMSDAMDEIQNELETQTQRQAKNKLQSKILNQAKNIEQRLEIQQKSNKDDIQTRESIKTAPMPPAIRQASYHRNGEF